MPGVRIGSCVAAGLAIAIAGVLLHAQVDSPGRSIFKGAAVEYLFPEQVTVTAGKATDVTLHFRVAEGLHINSHAPKEEFLIPTTFSIPEGSDVRLDSAVYPAGTEFTLPMDPSTKLSVYTNDFTIEARIVAPAGSHLVEGKLHFQACDKAVCLPPKTIPVAFNVVGK
jgi:hypothetical protein